MGQYDAGVKGGEAAKKLDAAAKSLNGADKIVLEQIQLEAAMQQQDAMRIMHKDAAAVQNYAKNQEQQVQKAKIQSEKTQGMLQHLEAEAAKTPVTLYGVPFWSPS